MLVSLICSACIDDEEESVLLISITSQQIILAGWLMALCRLQFHSCCSPSCPPRRTRGVHNSCFAKTEEFELGTHLVIRIGQPAGKLCGASVFLKQIKPIARLILFSNPCVTVEIKKRCPSKSFYSNLKVLFLRASSI